MDPEVFWKMLRVIVQEELRALQPVKECSVNYETAGLTYKPLFKIAEICSLFSITKPTIYAWIKCGKLHPHKIRSRVYFLWVEVEALWKGVEG